MCYMSGVKRDHRLAEPSTVRNFRLPDRLWDQLCIQAKANGEPVSRLVRRDLEAGAARRNARS